MARFQALRLGGRTLPSVLPPMTVARRVLRRKDMVIAYCDRLVSLGLREEASIIAETFYDDGEVPVFTIH